MYVPEHFAESDTATCHALIRDYPFGLLVTAIDGAPFASHLPFMLDVAGGGRGALVAHMARGNPHWRALAAGEAESGCTVHYCDNEYDRGTILVQKRVPVRPDDTPDTLAARVFEAECIAYPEAIRTWIETRGEE